MPLRYDEIGRIVTEACMVQASPSAACNHYGTTDKLLDSDNEIFYRCNECGKEADTIVDLLKLKGGYDMASKRTRRRKAARKRAHEKDTPLSVGESFRTTNTGTGQVFTCAGWTDEGHLQYEFKGATGETVISVKTWTREYVAARIEEGLWAVEGRTKVTTVTSTKQKNRVCDLCKRNTPGKGKDTCKACEDRTHCARCFRKLDAEECKHVGVEKYTAVATAFVKKNTTGGHSMKCRHYHVPYTLPGGYTVHASSMNNKRKDGDGMPDWGLYADWGWKPYWRAEHIDWPDYSIPFNDTIAFEQILVAIEKIMEGLDVEVGCIGGHGRTGTIIAAMETILGTPAKEAIRNVRKNYCSHAIETPEQEWWVEWVESAARGTECPKKPAYSYAQYGYGGGYTGGRSYTVGADDKKPAAPTPEYHCAQTHHFYDWMKGFESCPTKGKECQFFSGDVVSFEKGDFSQTMLKDEAGVVRPYAWHLARAKQGLFHPKDKRRQAKSNSIVTAPGYKALTEPNDTLFRYTTINLINGEWVTETFHAPPRSKGDEDHKPTKMKGGGCYCDVCRYTRLGHGAFLMPGELSEAAEYSKRMNALAAKADEASKSRSTEQHLEEGRTVQILLKNGKFVESRVSDAFAHAPTEEGKYHWEISEDTEWQWEPDQRTWIYIGALSKDDWGLRLNLAVSGAKNTNVLGLHGASVKGTR